MHTCVRASPVPAWILGLFLVCTAVVDVFPDHEEGQQCTHHMYSIRVEYSGMLHNGYFVFETCLLLPQNWAGTLIHIDIPEVFMVKLICFGWTQELCGPSWLTRVFGAQCVQSCFILTGNAWAGWQLWFSLNGLICCYFLKLSRKATYALCITSWQDELLPPTHCQQSRFAAAVHEVNKDSGSSGEMLYAEDEIRLRHRAAWGDALLNAIYWYAPSVEAD